MNIKKYTEDLGIRPSKKLGQNFLVHENTAKKILAWANFPPGSRVLEIGPGLGALTVPLLGGGFDLCLVEKDKKLFEELKTKMPSDVSRFQADILDFDLKTIFVNQRFLVISNAPYSISTPILEKMLTEIHRIDQMVFLFQEEVVDRICADAGNKDYGRLSIWIQSQCDVERGPRISKDNFFPKPDVESRLVRIKKSVSPVISDQDREAFLGWVSKIFQQRRKTLRKNLKDMKFEPSAIEAAFSSLSLDPKIRAETLSVQDLRNLFLAVRK